MPATERRGRSGRAAAAVLLALAVLVAGAAPGEGAGKPRRIVSLNLCTDLLLLDLVPRDRIASVTWRAADPEMSRMAGRAAGLALNRGTAEEVVALAPDLVLAGAGNRGETLALLRRLGYPVVTLPLARGLAGVRRQIRTVAAAVGEVARGEAMIREMDRRIDAARAPPAGRRPVAVLYGANGGTAGAGSLVDEMLSLVGFENLARRLGLAAFAFLGLEELVLARPEVLVGIVARPDAPSLSHGILDHPALRRPAGGPARVALPMNLLICPGPWVAEAVERLARARRALGASDGGAS